MTSNCLIDGTMTAFFKIVNENAVTMTARQNYQKMNTISSIRQTESVLYHRRAGLSYTVASREFVRQIPNTTAQSCCKSLGTP